MVDDNIYKFAEVLDPGDEDLRFVVIEDRGDRVLVREISQNGWPNQPTYVYLKTDLIQYDLEEAVCNQ